MLEFNTDKPTKSGMYLVDRGMQGKAYRYYNEKADFWGMCGFDMNEANENKDKQSAVGFFPWVGPLTGPKFDTNAPVVDVTEESTRKAKVKPAKKMAKMRNAVAPSTPAAPKVKKTRVSTKASAVHPDGTVWYREDRQKWIAMMNGKQEAARPTAEACLKFLKKKYNVDGNVIAKSE
jgi:hypothetical protein